jgi:hypothetical protein
MPGSFTMRKSLDDESTLSNPTPSQQDRLFTFTNVAGGRYILAGFGLLSVLLILIEGMRAMQ